MVLSVRGQLAPGVNWPRRWIGPGGGLAPGELAPGGLAPDQDRPRIWMGLWGSLITDLVIVNWSISIKLF